MRVYDRQDLFQGDGGHAAIAAKTRFGLTIPVADLLVRQHSRGVRQWLPTNELGWPEQGDYRCPRTGCQVHGPAVVANIEMAPLDQPGQLVDVELITRIGQRVIGVLAYVVDGLTFTCACAEKHHMKMTFVQRFPQCSES